MRTSILTLLAMFFLGDQCGCQRREAASEPLRENVSAAAETPAPELSFAEQARAVRNGQSDAIRLDRGLVRDADLSELGDLEDRLTRLNVARSEITDAGLAAITRCRNLTQLRLASSRLSDEGLAVLQALPRLKHLHLIGAPLTNGSLTHLLKLRNLSSLYLDDTELTLHGMRQLTEALPHTHIHFDGGHHRDDVRADAHGP